MECVLPLSGRVHAFFLSSLPSQAVLVYILVDLGRRSNLVTIGVHGTSRGYCIAVVATPGSLRCETGIFGSCAAQECCANQNAGRILYLHPSSRYALLTRCQFPMLIGHVVECILTLAICAQSLDRPAPALPAPG